MNGTLPVNTIHDELFFQLILFFSNFFSNKFQLNNSLSVRVDVNAIDFSFLHPKSF